MQTVMLEVETILASVINAFRVASTCLGFILCKTPKLEIGMCCIIPWCMFLYGLIILKSYEETETSNVMLCFESFGNSAILLSALHVQTLF